MKPPHLILPLFALLLAGSLLVGCGHQEGGGPDHGHGQDDGSPSGASFKAGKGVMLTEETRSILGLTIADVTERWFSNQIRFTVQVFGEKHHHLLNHQDHSGCDAQGSGLLSQNAAAAVAAGLPVHLLKSTNNPLGGVVLAVQKALALDEWEVVIGLSNAIAVLQPGEFVPACIHLPRSQAFTAVPESALLRTSQGAFVYTVNGDAYFRTAVKVGAEADGWVEIVDGLLAGDQVVTTPVKTLWLIELRATKGGGHSH